MVNAHERYVRGAERRERNLLATEISAVTVSISGYAAVIVAGREDVSARTVSNTGNDTGPRALTTGVWPARMTITYSNHNAPNRDRPA